ncbi:MAG: hypothetical protein GWN00_25660 [Aliifodinibius sp.]|nr:hypothetical protein [Fodinibius sp.]NIV14230.1 hypothetical protein [Fodinibius sp.]NIY28062.1 hypothetical protein [Fodinibius sp.]
MGKEELADEYDYILSSRQLDYLKNREEEGKVEVDKRINLTDEGIKIADAIILDLVTLH